MSQIFNPLFTSSRRVPFIRDALLRMFSSSRTSDKLAIFLIVLNRISVDGFCSGGNCNFDSSSIKFAAARVTWFVGGTEGPA
jgi:hypothetical protein